MRICKCFYINNLYFKRQKGDDAGSADVEEDEDLTYLTILKRIQTRQCMHDKTVFFFLLCELFHSIEDTEELTSWIIAIFRPSNGSN